MSLDLFANFERASNSSVFYRITGPSPYTITYKLSDISFPELDISEYYDAEYSFDGVSFVPFTPNLSGQYISERTVNASVPATFSFYVGVTSTLDNNDTKRFSLSATFLESFPQADFITYPSSIIYLNPSTNEVSRKTLNSQNFQESEGARFYGEGHTEQFWFNTTNAYSSNDTALWFVGSQLSALWTGQTATGNTASLQISSESNQAAVLPVHLLVSNNLITSSSSIFTYDDGTGEKKFYPFFSSTLTVEGHEDVENNTTLKQSISVLLYPEPTSFSLVNSFESVPVYLPFDYSFQSFVTKAEIPSSVGILKEEFLGSMWNISSDSEFGGWGGELDAFSSTEFLSGITAYQYSLKYQQDTHSPITYFKVSPLVESVTTVTSTLIKKVSIDLDPYDWKEKNVEQTLQTSLTSSPIPFSSIYTPNYYNIKLEPVSLEFIPNHKTDLLITKIEATSNISSDVLVIEPQLSASNEGSLVGEMFFTETGKADLNVSISFFDSELSSTDVASYTFPSLIEIVENYDDEDEAYYRSPLAALRLPVNEEPKITPNEWVTADNVNSIVTKFYDVVIELEKNTQLVAPKSKFIGMLTSNTDELTSYSKWKVELVDLDDYPLIDCSINDNRLIKDVAHVKNQNAFIIAHSNRLNVTTNERTPKVLATRQQATEIYNFQNIVSVNITPNGKVVVLDNVLLTISVFTIENNNLRLLIDWGGFGTASSPNAFNNPADMHVDQQGNIYVADTGNNCIKKFTITGKNVLTLTDDGFLNNPPLSVCVDSESKMHCLTNNGVFVFDAYGTFLFQYIMFDGITGISKINTSFNRELLYITHEKGIVKYFKTGTIADHTFNDYVCGDGTVLNNFSSVLQTEYRNVYGITNDKIVKIADIVKNVETKASLDSNLFWEIHSVLIHPEEYIQPWVYLKSFHRLWDNIELLRNSLFYNQLNCKTYIPPVYQKRDLVIGQNELVTNSVINRLSNQLWVNMQSLIKYFNCID
jgi:hypothetical protein